MSALKYASFGCEIHHELYLTGH